MCMYATSTIFLLFLVCYVLFVLFFFFFLVTRRLLFGECRREMNRVDGKAASVSTDALLNYETVKYFNNEDFEVKR